MPRTVAAAWHDAGMPRHASRTIGLLTWALLALIAAHDATHLFDDGLETSAGQLALVATPQWIVIAAVVAVILRGRAERAAIAALLLGAGTVLGFAIVHLLPFALAPYDELEPSAVSWVLVWVPTAAAVALAAAAARDLRTADTVPA